jgi:hypothetical protein
LSAIPAHYAGSVRKTVHIQSDDGQFPHITQDPYKFAESVQELGLKAEVLKAGEEIVL